MIIFFLYNMFNVILFYILVDVIKFYYKYYEMFIIF